MGDFFSGGAAHSSKDMTWATPRAMFDKLNVMFGPFTLDAAASSKNRLCEDYYTEETDALSRDWGGECGATHLTGGRSGSGCATHTSSGTTARSSWFSCLLERTPPTGRSGCSTMPTRFCS